jgi:hypothetical protein
MTNFDDYVMDLEYDPDIRAEIDEARRRLRERVQLHRDDEDEGDGFGGVPVSPEPKPSDPSTYAEVSS